MTIQAYIKYIRISPKKLRFLVDDIKTKKPKDALDYLYYSPKRTGKVLYKAIKSAVENAQKTHKVDAEDTFFKEILVEQGPVLKRFRAGGRGIAKPYRRPSSHIKVVLDVKKTKPKKVKKERSASSEQRKKNKK